MKRKLFFLFIFQLFIFRSNATVYSGSCGTNLVWSLDTETGVLDISGTGTMTNFSTKGPWMTYMNSISTVKIDEGVTSIGKNAFYSGDYSTKFTTFEHLYIPSTITFIGDMAFYCCDNIKDVYISDIDNWSQVSMTSLYASPFTRDDTQIYNNAGLPITNLIFSTGLYEIKDYTFYHCNCIKSVTLPNTVRIIGANAFRQSSIESINLDLCTTLEGYAFCNARNLKDVGDVSNVTTLGDAVFEDVNIPFLNLSSCSSMGRYLFDYSGDNIKSIIINRTSMPTFPSKYDGYGLLSADYNASVITNIYVPSSMVSSYKSNKVWSDLSDYIKEFVEANALNLSSYDLTIETGETITINANILSSSGAAPSVSNLKWTSNNEQVVTVNSDGVVNALSAGTAQIIVKTMDGSNITKQCSVTVTNPSNILYSNNVKAYKCKLLELPIYMNNDETISNYQVDLYLPDGITVKYDEDEEGYLITKGERLKTTHALSCKTQTDGSYRIVCTSQSNSTIKDTDKSLPVMYIPIEIGSTVAVGSYSLSLKNIVMSHYDTETSTTTNYTKDEMLSTIEVPQVYSASVTVNNTAYGTVSVVSDTYDSTEGIVEANDKMKLTATANTGYRFSNWTVNGSTKTANPLTITVTSNQTIKANFVEDAYTVTFKVDDVVYSSGKQLHGAIVKVPETDPTKEGYIFKGWDGVTSTTTVPGNDVTYNAVFEINKYNVKFIARGTTVYDADQEYNSTITAPDAPAFDGYSFITWGDVDANVPAHDVTYTADYVMIGDINSDTKLNVGDLTSLVGIILNNQSGSLTTRQFKTADVLVDDAINVGDYTSLVGKILNAPVSSAKARSASSSYIFEPTISTESIGNKATLHFNNATNVSALQFDVIVPEGMSINSNIRTSGMNKHNVMFKSIGDNTYRIVACSSNNEVIGENNEVELEFISVDNSEMNACNIAIENIVCASACKAVSLEETSFTLSNNGVTGVKSIFGNTELKLEVKSNTLYLTSVNSQVVRIYSIDGKQVITVSLTDNETKTVQLPNGTYVINGNKIIIK